MISNDTAKEYIYNLPDEEKELIIRYRLLSDKEKQKLTEQLSSLNNKDD